MSGTQKWIDLRGAGEGSRLKIGTFDQDDGRQVRVLYITGLRSDSLRWQNAIDKLGFIASPGKKYLVRKVREKESVRAADFHPVWPNAVLAEMPRDQILIDVRPIRQLRQTQAPRTEEERDISVESGMVIRLGRNAEGEEVFSGPMGRYLQRETGQKVYETDLLGPAMFLRAPTDEALNVCADGFVQAMLRGEVQHSDDLDRFMKALFDRDGPYAEELYTRVSEAVDASMVRTLNRSYDTAQDAFGDASRLYDYLPPYKGSTKGEGAMPLPLAVIAQRLLGDTSEKTVLVPNAWDGASFAFLSSGTRIHAFRGSKDLSALVSNVRVDDVTWGERFEPSREQGADGLFFNADPQRDAQGQRHDFVEALAALRTLSPGARAVLVMAGDDPRSPGSIADDSFEFVRALGRRYDIETCVEIGSELTSRLGTGAALRMFSIRNQPAGEHSFSGESIPVLHSWDELKTAVDEAIATANVREAQSEAVDIERTAAGNEFQRPYVAFSKVGEARTMVPLNLQGPLQFALSNLERVHGPVDGFVETELGFGPNTLGERFSPEQVDAVGLGIARMKVGRGIIIGDETGIGKGRTLSGYATWANKHGRDVILVTDRANLFSDLVRDLRDIGEWGRFRPLIVNADGRLVDVFTGDVIQEGTPNKTMNNIMAQGTTLAQLQCNMIYVTYSQISGEDSPKAEWLLSQSDRALVVVDEAHVAAGSNSNTSSVVSELVNRAWAVGYSSATWAKSSENLHIYSRAFPETINVASLAQTMRTGGEAFSEVFSSMLARDGAFIRREHDLSKIEFSFEVDTKRQARNEAMSDQVSGVLAAMTYVGGEINRLLIRMNSDTMKKLKAARENRTDSVASTRRSLASARADAARRTGQEGVPMETVPAQVARGTIMRSSFGAGSVLYQVMRRFLTVLNADQVAELALEAARQNRKPVIVFEDTGEAFLKRIIAEEIIPGLDGEKDILPEYVRAPTIKDLLRNVMKRLGVITINEVDESYVDTPAQQRDLGEDNVDDAVDLDAVVAEQDEAIRTGRRLGIAELPGLTPEAQKKYREGIEEIMAMIDALPPLPLTTVDVITGRLEEAGLKVGEISGRGMRLQALPEDRLMPIDDTGWDSVKLRVVARSKKKTDVNQTVLGFNSGDLDALLINGSAATGLSLHSSPRFQDVRRRELIELQIQQDPTKRIQLFGRVNRYDQVVTPKMSIPTTGIYGEVREVMMQNLKLARLSANIRSSRENAAEIKNIPNLLNPVGREVAKRFLEENGGIRNRLGISDAEVEYKHDLASLLTSRVALLFVREQRMVYEELNAMFEDTLLRYELQGENPLKPKEKDLRAKVVNSSIVVGIEMEGVGSAFDGPVYLRELEWNETKRPAGWRQMLDLVREGHERMLADGLLVKNGEAHVEQVEYEPAGFTVINGVPTDAAGNFPSGISSGVDLMASNLFNMGEDNEVDEDMLTPVPRLAAPEVEPLESGRRSWMSAIDAYSKAELKEIEALERAMAPVEFSDAVDKLKRILDAKVQIELAGSTFADVEAALQSNGDNGIKRAQARALWAKKYLPRMIPGCAVGLPDTRANGTLDNLAYEWGVVCCIKTPPKGREAMLSRWKVEVLFPGNTTPTPLSLSSFMDKATLTGEGNDVSSRSMVDGSPLLAPNETLASQALTSSSMRREHLMSRFRRETRRATKRRGLVMEGNLYLASEWAASTKMGSGVVYTDERGVRHRAIWVNERYSDQIDVDTMPVRLWSQKMIQRFMQRLIRPTSEGGCDPNGPGNTYLIPTSFHSAMPGGLHSDAGTRVMIVPGQAIALVVNKSDLGRMLRALRGHQKSWLRRTHPNFKNFEQEEKDAVNAQLVKISSSTRKRGERPVIFLACEQERDFEKATELLCAAAGIELYLPRRTQAGILAAEVQAEVFSERREQGRLQCRSALEAAVAPDQPGGGEVEDVSSPVIEPPFSGVAQNDELSELMGRMRVAT